MKKSYAALQLIAMFFVVACNNPRLPQSMDEIIPPADSVVNYLTDAFRARIPVYYSGGRYFTDYDFEKNKVTSTRTVYIAPDGSDSNSGQTAADAKQTLSAAIADSPTTVILLPGKYTAGKHFMNGMKLSDVNLIGLDSVVIDANGGVPLTVTGNFYCENITFSNGSLGSLHAYITSEQSKCTYVRSKFINSLIDDEDVGKAQSLGGLRIQGGTHYVYKCEAYDNGFDGFSYHAAPDNPKGGGTSPHIVEVECKAYSNGLNSNYESNNASTAHDGAQVLRLNCRYGNCHGGIVADVHPKTVSFNIGCYAENPADLGDSKRQFQANYFCAAGATFYMIDCESADGFYDVSCWNKGKVLSNRQYPEVYLSNGKIRNL